MKKVFTKILTLCLLLTVGMTAWAEDKTLTLDNLGATLSSTSNTTMATVDITATGTSDTYTLNYLQGKKQGSSILIAKSTNPAAFISNSTPIPGDIKSVTVYINGGASGKTTYYCGFSTTECTAALEQGTAVNITGGNSHTYTCGVTGARYFCVSLGNANNGQVLSFEVTYEEGGTPVTPTVATPVISPESRSFMNSQEVEITCSTEGAAIQYTTDDGANWIDYSDPFTVTETTTVIAKATKAGMDDSNEASATYTKVVPLATMDEIFAASETQGNYMVTLNDWVVSGVKGSNAYVTDGTKGFIVYNNTHGLSVGDVLSGTVELVLTRFQGSAETTNLTSAMTDLTVTTGGTVTPVVVSYDDLSAVNTGAVVTINNLTFGGTTFVDANDNVIKPYNAVGYDASFTTGNTYNVTGVYVHYNGNPKEIAPRSADDIEEVTAAESYTITIDADEHVTVTTDPVDEATAGTVVVITATPDAHYFIDAIVVEDSEGNEIEVTDDRFEMPADNVTIKVTSAVHQQFTVSYSSLGTSLGSEQVDEGETVASVPAVTNIPEGWTLAGWTEETVAETTTKPELVSLSAPVYKNLNLKAVIKKTEGGGASGYTKVTTEPADWSGDYLLVSGSLAWTGVDAGQCHVDVTIEDDVIAEKPEGAVTLTAAPMEGGYSLLVNGGDKDGKYIGKSANSNGIDFGDSELLNTLALDANENVVITAVGGCTMRYNASSGSRNERFRYHKSGQQAVQLYKYAEGGTTYYTTEEPVPPVPETVSITISAAKRGTFISEYDLDFTNTTVWATVCTGINDQTGKVVMTDKLGKVKAGTALYVGADVADTYEVPVIEDGIIVDADNHLVGNTTGAAKTIYDTDEVNARYVLQKKSGDSAPKFYRVNTAGNTVANGRAWLELPRSVVDKAGAKEVLDIAEEGDATAINGVDVANAKANANSYNLSGVRVGADYKGIVIVNGKKVLVK